MPSQYKYYELYSIGCFTSRTERLAVSLAFGSLLMNSVLFLASLSSPPFWSIGPPALFHMCAALSLFYAGWADQPSYCWLFLVINGFTIFVLALAFVAAFLLDLNPKLANQLQKADLMMGPLDGVAEIRQLELALLCLISFHWMAQGLIWHYYRYIKHRKVEQFFDHRASQYQKKRHGSFRISTLNRSPQIMTTKIHNGKCAK